MESRIEAVYENGIFRPLEAVALPEHLRVVLRVESAPASAAVEIDSAARQQRAAAALDAELEQLPDNTPDDGLSGADHDQILYGSGR